jgi:hypothetical protein
MLRQEHRDCVEQTITCVMRLAFFSISTVRTRHQITPKPTDLAETTASDSDLTQTIMSFVLFQVLRNAAVSAVRFERSRVDTTHQILDNYSTSLYIKYSNRRTTVPVNDCFSYAFHSNCLNRPKSKNLSCPTAHELICWDTCARDNRRSFHILTQTTGTTCRVP